MPAGTGLFHLPIPILLGSDKPTGLFHIPIPQMEGYGYSLADFTLPVFSLEGTGEARSGIGVFQTPLPVIAGTGLVSTSGAGQFILPMLKLTNAVTGGVYGSGVFTLPQFILFDIGLGHGIGLFHLPIPLQAGFGYIIPISTYRGVAMNISNQAISTYSNFRFNSLAYFDGKYFGANENGIYVLGGDTDNGMRIQSKLKTGPLNFGDAIIKNLRNIWLTYRSDGHLMLVILVDEDEDHPVDVGQTQLVSDEILEERLKVARGARGRFYTIELQNVSGADFDLDSLSFVVEAIRRKVR